jgi:branched-chain amino acid aminotransferase
MANYYNQNTIIFLDGKFVKAAESKIDLYRQSLHYGFAVFEGIRSYKTMNGSTQIFKAKEHYDRLKHSADSLRLPYPYHSEELIEATYEVLNQNNLQDAYIRPLIYGPSNMSFNLNTESHLAIQAWEMGAFLGDKLLRIGTSSFQTSNPKGI